MRFLLRYKYGVFHQKTERIYAKDIQTTDQLLEIVSKKVNSKIKDIILRYKQQSDYIRIIAGWNISHFEIKDGTELEVKVIERQEQEQVNTAHNKYLMNLFGSSSRKELQNVAEESQKDEEQQKTQKPVFSLRKYLDQELEHLLKYVQRGKLSSILKLLKQVPKEIEDVEFAQQIEQQKPKLLNQLGEGGWGAIHYAVFCKQLQILKQLIKRRININKPTADGWTPLQLALNKKNTDELKQLLNHPTIKINEITSRGTALHIASKVGFVEGVQLLLEKCADAKLLDDKGKLPIDYCEDQGCLKVFQSLEDKRSIRTSSIPFQIPTGLSVLRGTLMKAKAVFMNLKQRYLVLDPYEGTLIRYQDEQSYPKKPMQIVPLSTIKNIRILTNTQKTWQMKKQYCYLEIDCHKKLLFASRHNEIMNIWFQGLQSAIRFHLQQQKSDIKLKSFVKDQLKTVLILDDVNNKIIPLGNNSIPDESNRRSNQIRRSVEPSRDSINEPRMPISNVSITSSQFPDSKTSFTSELDKSTRLLQKSKSIDEDFDKLPDFSSLKSSDKIQFSNFTLIKELGSGAFGKVFLAKLEQTGKLYALKALKKRNLILGKQKKFAIEQVNILKQVNHPYIINLNYAFQTPQYLYLALDYCSGKDLNFHLMFEGTFSEEDTKIYMAQLFLAIEHLHSKKILYRDLKPENVLLDAEGHIKLTDFGLSKSNVEDKAKSFVGTQAYLSPDMLSGGGIDKEADIYGVGCILYECLVGQPPFYSDDLATLYQNIKQGNLNFPQSISQSAKNIIKGLLQRDPKKRLGSKSMQQIKSHQFFRGLDWEKLYRREISAPRRLCEQQQEDEDDELQILPRIKFQDSDYQGENKANRFNNFSFAR